MDTLQQYAANKFRAKGWTVRMHNHPKTKANWLKDKVTNGKA